MWGQIRVRSPKEEMTMMKSLVPEAFQKGQVDVNSSAGWVGNVDQSSLTLRNSLTANSCGKTQIDALQREHDRLTHEIETSLLS
jgi:hypothetical protein